MELNEAFALKFPAFFIKIQPKIQKFPGCKSVILQQDIHSKTTYFTISIWNSEDDLNNYRDSELFIETWKIVKPNFTEKATAWSTSSPDYEI